MTRAFRQIASLAPYAALAALLATSAPAWPDDWDGLGFLASVRAFDMDHFAPHPPGYPVYVAMLKLVARVVHDPLSAAILVAVLCGTGTAAFAFAAAARTFGPARAAAVAFAVVATPLSWRAASGVGSECAALLFASACAWGLAHRRGWALGAAAGLGMGARLSWAPLYLALLVLAPRGERARAAAGAAIGVVAWAAPLAVIVGGSHLVQLYATHLGGHMTRWGGTAIGDPGPARIAYLARDVVVDGLGVGTDGLGLVIAFLVAVVGAHGLAAWRRVALPGAGYVAIALAPYLAWIALGQNLRQQPRHALPLVAAVAAGLALAAFDSERTRRLGVALASLVLLRTAQDAWARKETPPPGAQMVEAVAALADRASAAPERRDRVLVFGGPSVRFFEGTDLAGSARGAATWGDLRIALGRADELPSRVLATSELEGFDDPPYPARPWRTFCRPPRIERRAPCVRVVDLAVPFLPHELR
jgi:hypothetical protein